MKNSAIENGREENNDKCISNNGDKIYIHKKTFLL